MLLLNPLFSAAQENYGDALVTPRKQHSIITVGGAGADVQGYTNGAIQLAMNALPPEGGTIKLDTGVYMMMAPVFLRSNVKLMGSGPGTVLRRIDGCHSKFVIDADYGELKITVEDASKFKKGMSIQVSNKTYAECWDVSTAVITDIVKDTLYFDKHLIRDYQAEPGGMVTNAGSCVLVYEANNVVLSDFSIDGNKEKNDLLDGCNGGGVAIIKSADVVVDHVIVKDFNGEGITWQITDKVTVRNCEISACTNMGLHPGTGSPNTIVENNKSFNNKVGLFICWRVQNSVVKNNFFANNLSSGISTGHKDSDVLFEGNTVKENGEHGIYIRDESIKNSPQRNKFIRNTIENNAGYGFYIAANAPELLISNNIIRNTGNSAQKAAIYVAQKGIEFKQDHNNMSGHATGDIQYGKK